MIERIVIKGYRLFEELDFRPKAGMNILVGDNEAGKSTLMEAVGMALTGRVNGRRIGEELNPFWFNRTVVHEYFDSLKTDTPGAPPEILIELYFEKKAADVQALRGVHNSLLEDCPGVQIHIKPSATFDVEFQEYIDNDERPDILPVEYYDVIWRDFADGPMKRRHPGLGVSVIDSHTIRSTSGVDYHTREMLVGYVEPKEAAAIAVAHRNARHTITEEALGEANKRIAADSALFHDRHLGLQVDQSSNASWEAGIVPQVEEIPFAMAGQGQQAAVKVALAMNRTADKTTFVLIEEPENHLSHTSLTRLISRIENLAGDRQVFLTTHSSFVLNRLGLDKLVLLYRGKCAEFSELPADTVRYFQRLSGYDTLRLVLADNVVLVEGPSDEMLFERAFSDRHGAAPMEMGVDVISMRGVALKRSLQLCAALKRKVAVLRDNDGKPADHWNDMYAEFLEDGVRQLFIGDPAHGKTLEPQMIEVNGEPEIRAMLGYDGALTTEEWMSSHKTEGALRLAETESELTFPEYFIDAVNFTHE
ncbi:AAA family ATPase [Kribbella sp. NPDC000426]|uniref:ATP-dependent nuclease n=1 Tax=Kribbella sp. NPDC000426 TaxID=3154255 RepID=UPI00331A4A80